MDGLIDCKSLGCRLFLHIAILFRHPPVLGLVEPDPSENRGDQPDHRRQQRLRDCVAG